MRVVIAFLDGNTEEYVNVKDVRALDSAPVLRVVLDDEEYLFPLSRILKVSVFLRAVHFGDGR